MGSEEIAHEVLASESDDGTLHVDLHCEIEDCQRQDATLVRMPLTVPPVEMPFGKRPKPHLRLAPHGGSKLGRVPHMQPPILPHPFSAVHQTQSHPQAKANWVTDTYEFLTAVPKTADHPEVLHHQNLEVTLTQRVIAAQPNRNALGYTDVVIKDMASSTVREIVGIIESLLDRLLLEKKLDTIRNMVAELMTSEIASTIATGREQLKTREFGHINQEIERLTIEAQNSATRWEERFHVTHELRDSQDDIRSKLNERCTRIEARVAQIEQGFVAREELDRRLKKVVNETESVVGHVCKIEEQVTSASEKLDKLEVTCRGSLVTNGAHSDLEHRLDSAVAILRDESKQGLQQLYEHAASVAQVQQIQAAVKESSWTSQTSFVEVRQEIDSLCASLKKDQQLNAAQFETKSQHQEDVAKLRHENEALESMLCSKLGSLMASAATKNELQHVQTETHEKLTSLQQTVAAVCADVKATIASLQTVEDLCENTLATRDFAHETAKTLAYHAVKDLEEKELIAQLRREFEEERERLRQTIRQVQVSRRDLGDMIEIFHETREKCGELGRTCSQLSQHVEDIDVREAEHWAKAQSTVSRQGFAQQQLDGSLRALREEFTSHTEMQRSEAEKLRMHSTQRYLEQMDKALDLHKSLETVAMGHKELSESVRTLKLPKVSMEPPVSRNMLS